MYRILLRFYKPLLATTALLALILLFYYSLIDALNKHKDIPIAQAVRKSLNEKSEAQMTKREIEDRKLQKLYEKSQRWMAQSRDGKLRNLLDNPVYATFNIRRPLTKKKYVTVLVIVSSGPRRVERRNAIRETWWTDCKENARGVIPECLFFTDRVNEKSKYYTALHEENKLHKDMRFQPLRGGIEFGIRFLYHMVWATMNYDFEYFVRVDDDYFFCLERFLWEVPLPMVPRFHWGFVHCILEIVRPEESMILLSRDLVQHFLLQDPTNIRCHPWADQMIAVWITMFGENELYRHDDRLHHAPVVDQMPKLRDVTDKCRKYIGIHGTYPKDMRLFWTQKGIIHYNFTSKRDRIRQIGDLTTNSALCELVHNFNYLVFEPEWQYEPKRCIYNPVWNTKKQTMVGGVYSGRQEDKRLALQDLKLKTEPPPKVLDPSPRNETEDLEPFDGA